MKTKTKTETLWERFRRESGLKDRDRRDTMPGDHVTVETAFYEYLIDAHDTAYADLLCALDPSLKAGEVYARVHLDIEYGRDAVRGYGWPEVVTWTGDTVREHLRAHVEAEL